MKRASLLTVILLTGPAAAAEPVLRKTVGAGAQLPAEQVSLVFLQPKANSQVRGAMTAQVETSFGVVRVEFAVDDSRREEDGTPPFEYVVDADALSRGVHLLTATAFDVRGASATASLPFISIRSTDGSE